jgi:hypothetical protein
MWEVISEVQLVFWPKLEVGGSYSGESSLHSNNSYGSVIGDCGGDEMFDSNVKLLGFMLGGGGREGERWPNLGGEFGGS